MMRRLPQEFAFPLGLGGKKQQSFEAENERTTNGHRPQRPNSITLLPGSSNSESSPRAPYQDLDTINL